MQIAKRQGVVNPENTFFSVKRFVGRKYDEIKQESTQVPYRLSSDGTGNVKIESSNAGKQFAPEEISASVLRKLADDAGKFLNDKVRAGSCLRCTCSHRSCVPSGLPWTGGAQSHTGCAHMPRAQQCCMYAPHRSVWFYCPQQRRLQQCWAALLRTGC